MLKTCQVIINIEIAGENYYIRKNVTGGTAMNIVCGITGTLRHQAIFFKAKKFLSINQHLLSETNSFKVKYRTYVSCSISL